MFSRSTFGALSTTLHWKSCNMLLYPELCVFYPLHTVLRFFIHYSIHILKLITTTPLHSMQKSEHRGSTYTYHMTGCGGKSGEREHIIRLTCTSSSFLPFSLLNWQCSSRDGATYFRRSFRSARKPVLFKILGWFPWNPLISCNSNLSFLYK